MLDGTWQEVPFRGPRETASRETRRFESRLSTGLFFIHVYRSLRPSPALAARADSELNTNDALSASMALHAHQWQLILTSDSIRGCTPRWGIYVKPVRLSGRAMCSYRVGSDPKDELWCVCASVVC